jgi:ABC-type transporter Mla MlaB component
MNRYLLAGALLLAVTTLGPITRLIRFWARCAKRRRQEAMIYLAYERGLITKAEIDGMLKQVDEFDGSCLSVIAERKRQCQQQHGEDERGISTRAILSRLRTG